MTIGRVTRWAIGPDGSVFGSYDDNPFINSIIYEVELPDGQVKEYAENVIAQNILTQVDEEVSSTTSMKAIIDYRKD